MRKTSLCLVFSLLFLVAVLFLSPSVVLAEAMSSRVGGRILLQVESRGEAWYVSPLDGRRYGMGRPNDAFSLMRQLGVGISNNNLNKIPVGSENLVGQDADSDGLSDMIEDSVGINKNSKDSDGDGYEDKKELLGGYNPNGAGKILTDGVFAKKQNGKIFLQVEAKGEAWYVNPVDSKRYFLGRPSDAFNLMRKLGLGVSNSDLSKIVEQKVGEVAQDASPEKATALFNGCEDFPDKLESCSVFECQVTYPVFGRSFKKEITGLVDGKCHYIEQMSNNGRFECSIEEEFRKVAAQYYRDLAVASSSGFNFHWEYGGESEAEYFLNGKKVANPLQEALNTGICSVYGY